MVQEDGKGNLRWNYADNRAPTNAHPTEIEAVIKPIGSARNFLQNLLFPLGKTRWNGSSLLLWFASRITVHIQRRNVFKVGVLHRCQYNEEWRILVCRTSEPNLFSADSFKMCFATFLATKEVMMEAYDRLKVIEE